MMGQGLTPHFEKMQGMLAAYLVPETYVSINGMMATKDDFAWRDKLFISDMIWMLDGPEQRAAQAIEARSDETGTGSAEGESAVPQECAKKSAP